MPPFTASVSDDALGRRPRSYDDLLRLAARYARDHLAGLTLTNHPTQLAITLTPDALRAATRDGTPTALLRAIPALPSLLSQAGYLRTTPDRRDRVDIRSRHLLDTRRVHLLAATAEIAGRPVELLFTVRENFGGQCFLDRVSERGTAARHRQDGGEAPDDLISEAPDDTDDATPNDAAVLADAGDVGATAPTSNPSGDPANAAPHSVQSDRLSALEANLRNPNVQAFLSTIAQTEGATYDTLYGGRRFNDYSTFPGYGRTHSPSGRYQINAQTYNDLSAKLGLTDFSPHTQDLMAAQLLVREGAMGPLLAGDFDAALRAASNAWASLPTGPNLPGRWPNQPYKPYHTVRSIFELNRSP
jgi:muramidase (phage lysozyme)